MQCCQVSGQCHLLAVVQAMFASYPGVKSCALLLSYAPSLQD
jgi:hypothetical protein